MDLRIHFANSQFYGHNVMSDEKTRSTFSALMSIILLVVCSSPKKSTSENGKSTFSLLLQHDPIDIKAMEFLLFSEIP